MSSTADGDFNTHYGVIHCRYPGPKNDPPYENVNWYRRPEGDVCLQGPALRAFKAAEVRATPRRMRRRGKVKPILITGVGYRSWSSQYILWKSDDQRFANPDSSMHVEALAVDIDMTQSTARRYRIKKALLLEGWHYAVSGEPWHASYTVSG